MRYVSSQGTDKVRCDITSIRRYSDISKNVVWRDYDNSEGVVPTRRRLPEHTPNDSRCDPPPRVEPIVTLWRKKGESDTSWTGIQSEI